MLPEWKLMKADVRLRLNILWETYSKKKKETFASESYFEMNPPAQYPRIALIRDVTDTNVIKLLLES